MKIDFTPYFEKYEAIVDMADEVFARVQKEFPECVKCKIKCADCCYALFDLTLIEAIYINHQFKKKFKGQERKRLIEKSNQVDRKIYMIKKKAYKDKEAGKQEVDILTDLAGERARCPLLNDEEMCDLYEYRPITCRLYGIPTSIEKVGHTCGKSGFVAGKQYPTVNLDIIQKKLYGISAEFVQHIRSRYVKMAEIIVPLSMAILTDYDGNYLGIASPKKDKTKTQGGENDADLP